MLVAVADGVMQVGAQLEAQPLKDIADVAGVTHTVSGVAGVARIEINGQRALALARQGVAKTFEPPGAAHRAHAAETVEVLPAGVQAQHSAQRRADDAAVFAARLGAQGGVDVGLHLLGQELGEKIGLSAVFRGDVIFHAAHPAIHGHHDQLGDLPAADQAVQAFLGPPRAVAGILENILTVEHVEHGVTATGVLAVATRQVHPVGHIAAQNLREDGGQSAGVVSFLRRGHAVALHLGTVVENLAVANVGDGEGGLIVAGGRVTTHAVGERELDGGAIWRFDFGRPEMLAGGATRAGVGHRDLDEGPGADTVTKGGVVKTAEVFDNSLHLPTDYRATVKRG